MDAEMIVRLLILFGIMFFCLFLRFPIAISIFLASAGYAIIFWGEVPAAIIGQGMVNGISSQTIVSILFYFLLGEILNSGGIGDRMIRFGKACIGHISGALAHINIITSVIFAGVSGSPAADSACVGSLMIPMMKKDGYTPEYSAAVTYCSSCIGPIIPPSTSMVLMALYLDASVRKLFLGGIVPGLLMGLFMLVVSVAIAKRRKFPKGKWGGWHNVAVEFKHNFFALLLPAGIIFCLMKGVGTVVEIGALSCIAAYFVAIVIYREMDFKLMVRTLLRAAGLTANVLAILMAAGTFTWIVSSMGAAKWLANVCCQTGSSTVTLILLTLALFFLGMILDTNVIQMVFIPLMVTTINQAGINNVHFGVLAALVCCLGLITPPVGMLIYMDSDIAGCSPMKAVKESLPYLAVLLLLVILIIIFPQIVTGLPNFIFAHS